MPIADYSNPVLEISWAEIDNLFRSELHDWQQAFERYDAVDSTAHKSVDTALRRFRGVLYAAMADRKEVAK
jgi:hypothetical protein